MGFLHELFGPSREEVWRELCQQINAQYVDGGFWKGDKILAQAGQWTITLDTYTVSNQNSASHTTSSTTYTRMRAPYINRDGLRFKICRTGLLSGLGTWLGGQDIEIGEPMFDQAFVIKGNNEDKVRQLLANPRIRQLMHAQDRIEFAVKDDEGWFGQTFPQGVDELYFSAMGDIRDAEQLRSLYELFAETLNHLCHIGSAYEDDPQLEL